MLYLLNQTESTNLWAKQHLDTLQDGDAVFTQNQTAGKGRLGSVWQNLAGAGLFYTVVIRRPMVQPSAFPLFAAMTAAQVLLETTQATVCVKWPNDLLLNRKKVCGILCERCSGAILCGIGINLFHSKSYFSTAHLPFATSLFCEGFANPSNKALAEQLAQELTKAFQNEQMQQFCTEGFEPFLTQYCASCVNLGKQVFFEGGSGIAQAIDRNGMLVVKTADGTKQVFSGEVRISGIYETL